MSTGQMTSLMLSTPSTTSRNLQWTTVYNLDTGKVGIIIHGDTNLGRTITLS